MLLEIAMALAIKEIMSGNSDQVEIAEKVFEQLLGMGFAEKEVQTVVDEMFEMEEFQRLNFYSMGISHVIFDLYDKNKRIPVELILSEDESETADLGRSFEDLYSGKIRADRFELFVEGVQEKDLPDETFN